MENKYLLSNVDFSVVSEQSFNEISKKNVDLDIIPMQIIWCFYFWLIFTTLYFSHGRWIKNAEKNSLSHKSSWTFDNGIQWCDQVLNYKNIDSYIGITQVSACFNCLRNFEIETTFYVLSEYTMSHAMKNQNAVVKALALNGKNSLSKWIEREIQVYQSAKRIMVPSEYIKNELNNYYSIKSSSVSVIGYGANFNFVSFSGRTLETKSKYQILFVGKRFEQKGGDVILKSLDILNKNGLFGELVIVGPRVNPCLCRSDVKFLGRIYERQALFYIYQKSDVFVIHSCYEAEAFGLVFLEAMANGTPCIASDIDVMPDILAMERGFVVPLQDFMMLAQNVRQLLAEDDLYEKMSKNGVVAVQEYYNWPAVVEGFLAEL
ncbi:glycosyltransferase family 4 protein [Vibrio cholerae]|uniref:glycosyltransferase family 4 protein n=1 Tax=Vibrio cholerae TaxID=666 RepID=UPI000B49135A|nr:glycosyltransferase family 4 protein [Vibrio cholerae]EGR2467508.1 glycosyltransferase [Vibrio cholerae]ELY5180802.1 glycosyltransferase family 4 protein [Vibrio cholerae]KAA1197546.1 glycosyltransferase family 4 protein [Vibrio cholerae]KAA1205023.1 glycosyltransferase family 4 protein [Vibrio cholerae]KAA1208949.1 glycosyltransferase family 4 protein [Vibrio cholerae]